MLDNTALHSLATTKEERKYPGTGVGGAAAVIEGTGVDLGLGWRVSMLCFPPNPNPKWGLGLSSYRTGPPPTATQTFRDKYPALRLVISCLVFS
jgi:hypothetical protein